MLRTALLLSLLTDQPFRMENIRAGRANPGLKPQHLQIIKALQAMSESTANGAELGASTVTFVPGQLQGGSYSFDIGTAGATPLLLQTLFPALCFAGKPTAFTITGGTDVLGAMTIAFWQEVILPFLQPYAAAITFEVLQHGYFPVGGGRVHIAVTPYFSQADWQARRAEVPPVAITERGDIQAIQVLSHAANQLRDQRVATRQAAAFTSILSKPLPKTKILYSPARSPGSSVTAIARFTHTRLGADALGARGKSSEEVGREAAHRLQAEVTGAATVDRHTADNLMVWAALFGGHYTFAEQTGHIKTNAWVINQFLPDSIKLTDSEVIGTAL
jgi:RNA 3'-phosphate cyclase